MASTSLFFQLFFKEAPDEPPSAVAAAPIEKIDLKSGFKMFCSNRSLILLTMAFGCFSGMAYSFGNVVSGLFSPYGRDSYEIAIFGLTCLFGGFVGATTSGIILDKTSAYKRFIQTVIFCAIINVAFLSWVVLSNASRTLFMICGFLLGFCCFSALPATLSLGVELTFPMSPVLVNGVMLMIV